MSLDPSVPTAPAPEGTAPPDAGPPWPPRAGEGSLGAFGRAWSEIVLRPASFFRDLPSSGAAALAFFLLTGVLAAGVHLFWRSLAAAAGIDWPGVGYATGEAWSPLIGFLFSPLWLLVALGLATVVVHLFLLLAGGARRGIGTTGRTLAYAYAPALLAVIPLAGDLAGAIGFLVLAVIGLREAHRTDGWRATLAVVLPPALAIGAFVFLLLVVLLASASLRGVVQTLPLG